MNLGFIAGAVTAVIIIILAVALFFICKRKPESDAMELGPADSEHIIFKKEKHISSYI